MRKVGIQFFEWSRRGLTFGEMLVVLAVFLVLAVIFMFSSQTAMVKTRVSVVLQEQRLISRALEAYEADFIDTPTEAQGLKRLQSPTGYLPRVPKDPFDQNAEASEYQYFSKLSPKHKWVVVSVGPDGDSDVATFIDDLRRQRAGLASGAPSQYLLAPEEVHELFTHFTYDPTNGSVSGGDVITLYGE